VPNDLFCSSTFFNDRAGDGADRAGVQRVNASRTDLIGAASPQLLRSLPQITATGRSSGGHGPAGCDGVRFVHAG
jgi:hypothetical protein